VDIDAWPENAVYPIFDHLQTEEGKQLLIQFPVESTCQHRSIWKRKCMIPAVEAHPARSIIAAHSGDSEITKALCDPAERCRRPRRHKGTSHSLSADDGTQVLIRELCNEVFHPAGAFLYIRQLQPPVSRLGSLSRKIFINPLLYIDASKRRLLIHKVDVPVLFAHRHTVKLADRRQRFLFLKNHPVLRQRKGAILGVQDHRIPDILAYIQIVTPFLQHPG